MPIAFPASPSGAPSPDGVSLDQARRHLNFDEADESDDDELQFMVDAANAWVATQVDDVTPAPVQLATLELVRHFWDSQHGGVGANPLDDEPADGEFSLGLLGFSIPNRVKELLSPYVQDDPVPDAVYEFPDALDWPDPAAC